MKLKKVLIKVLTKSYSFFEDRWLLSTFVLKLSVIWFSLILNFLGSGWLIDKSGKDTNLTVLGWILTIAVVLLSLYIAIVERFHIVYNPEKLQALKVSAEKVLLDTINSRITDVCQNKCEQQIRVIKDKRLSKKDIPHIYTSPCEQLEKISKAIVECVISLISKSSNSFKVEDFRFDIFYHFPKEDGGKENWKVSQTPGAKPIPISVERLLKEKSTLAYLLNEEIPYVFFNNKQRAKNDDKYIKDKTDRMDNNELAGSIACFKLDFGYNEETLIESIITISTSSKRFIDEKQFQKGNELTKNEINEIEKDSDMLAGNIYDNIIQTFRYRIGVELCNYYLQFLERQQDKY